MRIVSTLRGTLLGVSGCHLALAGRDAGPGLVPVRIVGALKRTLPAGRGSPPVIACLVEARVRVGTGDFAVLERERRTLRAGSEGMERLRGLL